MLFESQEKAENFLKFNVESIARSSLKVPSRSYYCSFCCGWHITSMDGGEIARGKDERDGLVWEGIELAKKGSRAKSKKVGCTIASKSSGAGNKLSSQVVEVRSIVSRIGVIYSKIRILLVQTDYEEAERLLEESRALLELLRIKVEEYGMETRILNAPIARVEEAAGWLENLKSLVGKQEEQNKAIAELQVYMHSQWKSYRHMLLNLKYKEDLLRKKETVGLLVGSNRYDEAHKLIDEMQRIAFRKFGGAGGLKIRKWAKQEWRTVDEEFCRSRERGKKLVAAIDLILAAKEAYDEENFMDCRFFLMQAERRMSDIEKDEHFPMLRSYADSLWQALEEVECPAGIGESAFDDASSEAGEN